ncbi:MAG: queuosine precursor transporter [Lentisphaeria bacterium]|nr:queuosine precursor transporter [Lentisphaeria bacterium]
MVPENPSQNRASEDYMPLVIISGMMIALYVISNILATKLVAVKGITISDAGTLTFPLVYMLGDVLTEHWGFRTARKIIYLGFFCNLLTVLYTAIAVHLPSPEYHLEASRSFNMLFCMVPRITFASLVGFLTGELSNSWSLILIRNITGRRLLWMRTIGSSVVGFAFDTVLFVVLAFGGTSPAKDLWSMIWVQFCIKMGMEAFMSTPLAYAILHCLNKNAR